MLDGRECTFNISIALARLARPGRGASLLGSQRSPHLSLAPAWFSGWNPGWFTVQLLKRATKESGWLTWSRHNAPLSTPPPPSPSAIPKAQITQVRGTNFAFSFWFFFLPVESLPALMLSRSNSSSASQPTPHPSPSCPTALEILAVWQGPGSAELDSIPGFVSFFQNLYLTSLALKGISQVRAGARAKGLGLHEEFWTRSPRMDLREFANIWSRPQQRVGLCGVFGFFFFFFLSRVLSF